MFVIPDSRDVGDDEDDNDDDDAGHYDCHFTTSPLFTPISSPL